MKELDTSKACRRNPNNQNRSTVNHINKDEQSLDVRQKPSDQMQSECEYTTSYLIENKKTLVNNLRPTAKVYYMHNTDTEHIRPLWVSKTQKAQVYHTDCEVDRGAGCNILPAHVHNNYSVRND